MNNLADIIVYLLAYFHVAGKDPDDGHTLDCNRADDDEKALEIAYGMLDSATPAEYAALRAAVERAIAEENATGAPRYDWIAAYERILATDINEREESRNNPPA